MDISIVIPVYNELPSIVQKTVDDLLFSIKKSDVSRYQIVIVNDGTKRYDYSKIRNSLVINHKINKGYGASLKTGIKNAKYDWIAITDADGTYPNRDLNRLLQYCPAYDIIIGKRDKRGIPFIRRFPKFILRKLTSFLVDHRVPDLNSGFRVFRKEIALKYWNLFPHGFSFTSTLTMLGFTRGYDIKFVPIDYFKRKGTSSIHPIKDTFRFFTLIFKLTLYFNPLRSFIPLSLLLLILAIIRGLRDFLLQDQLGGLTLVLFFMSFQVFFFGLIAEVINKK